MKPAIRVVARHVNGDGVSWLLGINAVPVQVAVVNVQVAVVNVQVAHCE
jgi:hypothetical protein